MRHIKTFVAGIAFIALSQVSVAQDNQNASQGNAHDHNHAIIFSKRYKNLSIDKAYSLQKAFVKNTMRKGIKVSGFKAGFTSLGAPQKYGLEQPVTGVLIEKPLQNNAEVSLAKTHLLMVEQELAFKIDKVIKNPISLEELKASVSAVAPAVELPDVSFAEKGFTGFDVVANNVLSYQYIIGDWQNTSIDLDGLEVTLMCNQEVLGKGEGSNALGNQWQALHWMVNNIVKQGYKIQPGQILLTGTLIDMKPARDCAYEADFGALGKINFNISS